MSSPYEDDVMRLLVEKRETLRNLQEKESSQHGFFGKWRLAREIQAVGKEITYLEEGLQRYRNGLSWNRKTSQ
ncbi:MAG: hypothetical protein V3R13_02050 [Nitrososphaerales archaeon]